MGDRNKKKDQLSSDSHVNGKSSVEVPFAAVQPKTFERRASEQPNTLPPKMPKTPEPFITEPETLPLVKSRFASTDLLSNGRGSPVIERQQTSTQSVTVQQRRQYQQIVDGPNGRQVINHYTNERQNSHHKEQIESRESDGETKVDHSADHKFSSSSAAQVSIDTVDSMNKSLRAACAALTHSQTGTSSTYTGSILGTGDLIQTSTSESVGMHATQNPDGSFRAVKFNTSDGGTMSQNIGMHGLMNQLRHQTPTAMENDIRTALKRMVDAFEQSETLTPMIKNRMSNDGVVDLLIDNVDSADPEVSILSVKVLDKCLNSDARERLMKKGIDSIVRVATIKENVESRRAGTGLIEKILNSSETDCSEVVRHGGLDAILEACKSQDLETQRSSALALLNLSLYGGQFSQYQMIKQRAQDWLFPLAFRQQDKATRYFACLCVGSLIANKELEAAVVKSGTLDLVNEFVTDNSPEIFANIYAEQLDPKQSCDVLVRLLPVLQSRIIEVQQLAAFHFATEAHARKRKNDLSIFREIRAIEHLKFCASSPNDIASKLAGEVLTILGESVPHRLTQQIPLWTMQDVRQWIQQIGFSSFAKNFVENEVDGDLLLQLTEGTLQDDLKMQSRIQRQRFIRDLLQLKRISDYASCDPFNIHSFLLQISPEFAQYTYNLLKAGIDPSVFTFITDDHLRNDAKIENGVHRAKILDAIRKRSCLEKGSASEMRSETDVFISYRRATGSQLASLLKVYLQLRGFSVFIDIDKLDAGAFDQKLIDSVRMAKHFVLILSPSALDRCIGDEDKKDWIHREISAALAYNCNVVPVFDTGFSWPPPDSLPQDMQSICKFNGIQWNHDYQDACVDKLEHFLRGDFNIKSLSGTTTGNNHGGTPSLPSAISYHGGH